MPLELTERGVSSAIHWKLILLPGEREDVGGRRDRHDLQIVRFVAEAVEQHGPAVDILALVGVNDKNTVALVCSDTGQGTYET
ncbi:hypothetical protein [Mesorhizobium sp. M1163]|uniref:hypothetical protein n=1 Tax=Mesorhizobium sp. M1163 TaxID=2957065 RepID=UPI0033378589